MTGEFAVPPHTPDGDDDNDRPSKSARKREAHAAQDLGETLIGLRDSELIALDLPEQLTDAIREARRITSRAAGARQRQYIGKLMRDIDLEPIRAALSSSGEQSARETERFKRLEAWRERLIKDGPAAVDELERWRPGLDRNEWLALINAAQVERARSEEAAGDLRRAGAARELFRALRTLFESEPGGPEGKP
jgi:ribosome-associated protein